MSKWRWLILRYLRKLWVRSTMIGGLGIAAAVLATVADRVVPYQFTYEIGSDAIDSLLTIIASSMLAVSTFSLSVMASTLASASSSTTPRVTKMMVKDGLTQNVLATFVGSFLFSIVGLVALKAGAYNEQGRVVLFIFTIAVLALIVVKLLQWIDHLTRFGRVGETCEQLENITAQAIRTRKKAPFFGAQERDKTCAGPSSSAIAVPASRTGYVLHFDMEQLSDCAEIAEGKFYLEAIPGEFIYEGTALGWLDLTGATDIDINVLVARLQDAFTLDDERDFEDDPGHGISVLNEIALRALSPAVNDPGTAIDVIGRLAKLLKLWADAPETQEDDEIIYPRVFVHQLDTTVLFTEAFESIARDGAAMIEVQVKLRKACQALARVGDPEFRDAAREQAALALKRAEIALQLEEEKQRLAAITID